MTSSPRDEQRRRLSEIPQARNHRLMSRLKKEHEGELKDVEERVGGIPKNRRWNVTSRVCRKDSHFSGPTLQYCSFIKGFNIDFRKKPCAIT